MERDDEVGAVAAAEYFMALYNHVIATGDLEEWRTISAASCDFCSNVSSAVDELYASGGRFAGGEITISGGDAAFFSEAVNRVCCTDR